MKKVVLPNDEFLNPDFVEKKVLEYMKPQLMWLQGLIPMVKVDAKGIRYYKESAPISSDSEFRKLRPITPGSKFANVTISQLEEGAARIQRWGFQVRISEDARESPEGIDEITRAYEKVAYYLAMTVNAGIGAALVAGLKDGSSSLSGTEWSEGTAKPVDDLIALQNAMENGTMYTLTDAVVHRTNYRELSKYLMDLNVDAESKTKIWGVPDFKGNFVTIPALGITVHSMPQAAASIGGISEGTILGLDANFPPATYYYTQSKSYPNVTENNIGFAMNRFTDNETHDEVFQMWVDYVLVVKDENAGIVATGI